jgi:signal transduction histidine kinase
MTGNVLLLEQAVNNLVDNAIRHNRAGGHVTISIDRTSDGRVSLRVEDDGPGAPDDVLAKLNANRRFRGDEGRAHQTGELGLGLAVVREVSDRLGIRWAFRRSARGWFQAELTK